MSSSSLESSVSLQGWKTATVLLKLGSKAALQNPVSTFGFVRVDSVNHEPDAMVHCFVMDSQFGTKVGIGPEGIRRDGCSAHTPRGTPLPITTDEARNKPCYSSLVPLLYRFELPKEKLKKRTTVKL